MLLVHTSRVAFVGLHACESVENVTPIHMRKPLHGTHQSLHGIIGTFVW